MFLRLTILSLLIMSPHALAQLPEGWEKVGHNVRVMKHQDGSRTFYRRAPEQSTLVKKTTGPNGSIRSVTHYYIDDNGNPRSCKIFDSRNKLLFKVSYAYQISTGRLLAERMYYADKKDAKGNPYLASETRYSYDAQGNRSKPITVTFAKGKTAEEIFGIGTASQSTYPEKTFEDQKFLANPNSSKLGE